MLNRRPVFFNKTQEHLITSFLFFLSFPTGAGVPGTWHLRSGGQVLEEGHERDRGHQDPEEPSVIRAPRTDRGVDSVPAQSGECGRVQLCQGVRVLPAQEPHVSRV